MLMEESEGMCPPKTRACAGHRCNKNGWSCLRWDAVPSSWLEAPGIPGAGEKLSLSSSQNSPSDHDASEMDEGGEGGQLPSGSQ
jgi:hypothetical protein